MGNVPIPDDWTGDYCKYSICWPRSEDWLAVLRGVLYLPATGRYWLANTGSVIGAQAVILETLDYNFAHEEVILACNDTGLDTLAAAIQAGLTAIANSNTAAGGGGCCGPSTAGGGQFPEQPGGADTSGDDPAVDDPPEGYPDWDSFFEQKCGEATNIIEDLELSLGHLTVLTIAGLSIEGIVELLIVALTLTISTAGIMAIAGLLLTLGAVVIAATALALVNDNEQALICALIGGTNSATSRASFIAKFNQIVDDASIDPVESFAIKQLVSYLVETTEINRMYDYNPGVDYSGYDCPCPPACCMEFANSGDTQGWTPIASDPLDTWTFPVAGDVAQSNDDGGVLKFDLEISGASAYASAYVSDLDCLIEEGSTLCIAVVAASPGSFNNYLTLVYNTGPENVYALTSDPVGVNTYDLSAHAGDTLQQIYVGWSRAAGEHFVSVAKIGVCPTCE